LADSKIGVEQMISKAKKQELKLNGIVADVLNLKLEEKFDVILFDMLLHSFEKQKQFELLKKYSNSLNKKSILCVIFPDDLNSDHFMNMLKSLPFEWNLIDEITIKDVPQMEGEDSNFAFIMMVVRSIS
jgi:trans-aconitate methyltransferase